MESSPGHSCSLYPTKPLRQHGGLACFSAFESLVVGQHWGTAQHQNVVVEGS